MGSTSWRRTGLLAPLQAGAAREGFDQGGLAGRLVPDRNLGTRSRHVRAPRAPAGEQAGLSAMGPADGIRDARRWSRRGSATPAPSARGSAACRASSSGQAPPSENSHPPWPFGSRRDGVDWASASAQQQRRREEQAAEERGRAGRSRHQRARVHGVRTSGSEFGPTCADPCPGVPTPARESP